jgi:hypothetical protein
MFRLQFAVFAAYQAHNAKGMGAVFAPYTDLEMQNWSTKGHPDAIPELVDRIEDLNSILIQLRSRMPKTSQAEKDVYENTKKQYIESAHGYLVNTLIAITTGQEGFKNMESHKSYKAHKAAYNLIPSAQIEEYFKQPFQHMFVTFAEMFARRMTCSTVKHTSLYTQPDVEKETLDDFTKIMDNAADTLLKNQLPSITDLVDHLRATQIVVYINKTAENKNLHKEYTGIFKVTRTAIATDPATDGRPFDGARLAVHKRNLDTALFAAGFQEMAPPLSAAHLRALAAPAPNSTRPPRRRQMSDKDAAAGDKTISRPCFHCNKIGHIQPNCPVATTPASIKIAAKRKVDYMQVRDARRATRETSLLVLAAAQAQVDADKADGSSDDNEQDNECFFRVVSTPCVSPAPLSSPKLCPCLRTIFATKGHSVSFSDVYTGEVESLCPNLRHISCQLRAKNPDFLACNPGTKPSPSSTLIYEIDDNSSHYHQWHQDVLLNRGLRTAFYKANPDFKKDHPGNRWLTDTEPFTYANTQKNQKIRILCITLAEAAAFLGLLKKPGHYNQPLGPVIDSGASRHAGNQKRDVLTFLPTSFLMHPAIGPPVTMPAVLLGIQTMTPAGKIRLLPLPGAGVYDPTMPECLISVAQLLAAAYHVFFRLPQHCATDGFDTITYPQYGGFITIPHKGTTPDPHDFIIMRFENNTWRLPSPPLCSIRPLVDNVPQKISPQLIPTDTLTDLPLHWDTEGESIFSEQEQRALQLSAARKLQVKIYHDALGHCNNRLLGHSLKQMGISVQHLQPYINAYKCNACTANLGRRGYLLTPKTDTIISPKDTISSEANISQTEITSESILDASATLAPELLLPLPTTEIPLVAAPVSTFVEPILDVRADFADSCQIGRSGNRWFLLIIDKTTEYVSVYNTKTRSNPLALLKEYIAFTGRKIWYLRMDNVKEFHSEEMLIFCRDNGIIIQPVVAYNHTTMCRVESYIGVVKSHGRVGMLNANVPLRFHGDAVLDFCIKRNFTWYSQKGLIGKTTAHDRMSPAFDNTVKNVCIPFGSRIISPIPREHSLVRGSSFGDRFVEGIYLHAALTGPTIHIFDMHRKQEIVVKDFTSYPSEFPFKDPSCLTRPGYTAAEIEEMHQEDLADEARITAELTAPAVTRSQSAQLASKQPLLQAPLQPAIIVLSPELDLLPSPAQEPPQIFISPRDRLLDAPLSSIPELELGRAILNSGYPVILPPSFAAFPQLQDFAPAAGPMVVVGYKVQKLSSSKAALWVRFTSPPEYVGKTIQMYVP